MHNKDYFDKEANVNEVTFMLNMGGEGIIGKLHIHNTFLY